MTDLAHGAIPDAVSRLAGDYLGDHHLEAARRLTRLFDRSRMMQRATMSYDPVRVGGNRHRPVQADLSDNAAEARQRLARLAADIPADCWGVMTDVCGFEKGLQQVEVERNWPRRSAKLVLRIGLDRLATLWGLTPTAEGRAGAAVRAWLPDRVPMFPDETV